ncbi:hypothetical protein N657DRAFT_651379 [Parathielavia appendiculata]|uniref:Uncharacterized protein n=1 Tax=Parathielavia appendiculata TaxID=2587402 RepID=A0AAN6TPP0_9PEZI|nr:hypothetical protein N657DRAFT_651379 [Parathielavia appendiculata]
MANTAAAEHGKPSDPAKLTLEAWSQGFMVGALIIMCGITLANMRRGVLLHKLILIELLLAVPNAFFIFFDPPVWGWFLSSTVVPLITSWTLHNVIAWMKSKPFLGRRGNLIYIGSVVAVQPYWILEIYANFAYFNGRETQIFNRTRPYEAVFRDPWWIFTIINLFWNIRFRYDLGFIEIVQVSPRFGILLLCMGLSMVFIIVDILAVTPVIPIGVINPFWKFAFVFKCFTDSIILDDFRAALDKLSRRRMAQILPFSILGEDAVSGPEQSFVGGSPRKRKRQRKHGGSVDEQSITKMDMISSGKACIELSEAGELSPPSPVRVHHIAYNSP